MSSAFDLFSVYESLPEPQRPPGAAATYSVARISGAESHLIACNPSGLPALLLQVEQAGLLFRAPIAMRRVTVLFNQRCRLAIVGEGESEGVYTVVSYDAADATDRRYFLALCEAIVSLLGTTPTNQEIEVAVGQLASVLARRREPSEKRVAGIYGEVYAMWRSARPELAASCWRSDVDSRFDFGCDEWRMDVKTTSSNAREHVLSYDQANPPGGTRGFIASMFLERMDGGTSLGDLTNDLFERLQFRPGLIGKLQFGLASTLGPSLSEALDTAYDLQLATESFEVYDAGRLPAIRDVLPLGVRDVHFRVDFGLAPKCEDCDLPAGLRELLAELT